MQDRVQQLQDKYFDEYKIMCSLDPQRMRDELTAWEEGDKIILDADLVTQSSYADYVTRKMCENQPEDVIAYICQTLFDEPQMLNTKLNSCAIGGLALYLCTLNRFDGHAELKKQTLLKFNELIEVQRHIPSMDNCVLQ